MVMHVLLPAVACQSNYSAPKGAGQVAQLPAAHCATVLEESSNTVQFP